MESESFFSTKTKYFFLQIGNLVVFVAVFATISQLFFEYSEVDSLLSVLLKGFSTYILTEIFNRGTFFILSNSIMLYYTMVKKFFPLNLWDFPGIKTLGVLLVNSENARKRYLENIEKPESEDNKYENIGERDEELELEGTTVRVLDYDTLRNTEDVVVDEKVEGYYLGTPIFKEIKIKGAEFIYNGIIHKDPHDGKYVIPRTDFQYKLLLIVHPGISYTPTREDLRNDNYQQ